jgi:hypothetical protein
MILTFTPSAYVGTLAAVALYLLVRKPRGFSSSRLLVVFLLVPRDPARATRSPL